MENILTFLTDSLPYLRDFATTFVALTGAVVAILTYRRAKETLLQPVRSEVIKRQTDMLIEVLSTIGSGVSVSEKADYRGIIEVNILGSMLKCGAIFNDVEQIRAFLDKKVKGSLLGKESSEFMELAPVFEPKSPKKNPKDVNKVFYDKAKKGTFNMPMIDMTGESLIFLDDLKMHANNPLMPKAVSDLLTVLREEIMANIEGPLVLSVEGAINDSFASGGMEVPNPSGVFNRYNRKALSHSVTVSKIKTEIRQYLKIDSMP